ANMLTVITPVLLLGVQAGIEHVGQFSMQISSGSGSVLHAPQHSVDRIPLITPQTLYYTMTGTGGTFSGSYSISGYDFQRQLFNLGIRFLIMNTVNVQFSDSGEETVISCFGTPQDPVEWPNQGVLDSSDARWKAFYDTLPSWVQVTLPSPE
ncbi:hypothetical protein, partial [Paraburkholderia sp. Ac-20347]|uniref:hypothetical protein n=1 Tax=Paraburkholderia sp. Ac-20347 TaxID=2703892 RepID=UPI00197DFB8A